MARILVLGASGRIGTLLRAGWDHDGLTADFTFQTRDPAHPTDTLWDVTTPLPPTLGAAFDCMIVLAGIVPRAGATFAHNTKIGAGAVQAAAALGIKRILMASTSAVYGAHLDRPFHEGDTPLPLNDYGRSKLAMEEHCRTLARDLGLEMCNLRIGNVAGADALLLNGMALRPGDALQIDSFADGGTPLRSYIGPLSLARVVHTLATAPNALPEVLNVATDPPLTMGALADAAGMPFALTAAASPAHQHVTLACDALTPFHRFDPSEATPAEMVRQWRMLMR